MRWSGVTLLLVLSSLAAAAQAPTKVSQAAARDAGVHVKGWRGRVDPKAEKQGARITDSKLAEQDGVWHLTTGAPAIYWSAGNAGSGTYTVKANFVQHGAQGRGEFYGVLIGGSRLDQPLQNYLYCVMAGNGTFEVRHRIGDEVHQLAGRTAHRAIKAPDAAGTATNSVSWNVTPERASCLVNGTEVWGYAGRSLVGEGKLESLDGLAGIRADSGLDLQITGFSVVKAAATRP